MQAQRWQGFFKLAISENEGRCSAFDMEIIFHSHANKTHFHKKGCAPSLILKVRVFGTRKWPIRKLSQNRILHKKRILVFFPLSLDRRRNNRINLLQSNFLTPCRQYFVDVCVSFLNLSLIRGKYGVMIRGMNLKKYPGINSQLSV